MTTNQTVTVKAIEDIPAYEGEYAIPGICFRHAREPMGVSAWGMNVLELAPNVEGYPEHDHAKDGQEEVYVVLQGAARLVVGDGTEHELAAGMMVRVPPALSRKWVTADSGVTLLALGGTPGKAYASDPRLAE